MSPCLADPLGFRADGRPFWAFWGGGGEAEEKDTDLDTDSDSDEEKEKDEETDPLKRARSTIEKISAERKAIRDEYRPFKAALRELGIESPEALKAALTKGAKSSGGNSDVDIEKVREDARREARQEANRDLALAKVEALATGIFADPEDAVARLGKNVDDLLGRDGKPDSKAIKSELADLLEEKPHWGIAKRGEIDFDGGPRQSGGSKQSMDSFLRQASARKRGN